MCMTHAVSLECTRSISSVSSLLSLAPLVSTISLQLCFLLSHKHFRPSHHHGWGHAAGRQAFQGQAGVSGGQQPSSWQDCKYTFSHFCMCVFASYLMLSVALFLTSLFVSLALEQVLSVCAHHTLKLPSPLSNKISCKSSLSLLHSLSFHIWHPHKYTLAQLHSPIPLLQSAQWEGWSSISPLPPSSVQRRTALMPGSAKKTFGPLGSFPTMSN